MSSKPPITDYFVRRCTSDEGIDDDEGEWCLCRNGPHRVIAVYRSQISALEDAIDLAYYRTERGADAQVHLQDAFDAERFETYWHARGTVSRYG